MRFEDYLRIGLIDLEGVMGQRLVLVLALATLSGCAPDGAQTALTRAARTERLIAVAPSVDQRLMAAAAAARPAIVEIRARSRPIATAGGVSRTASETGGAGVVIRADGLVLTNEHVVRDAEDVWVGLADGSRVHAQRVLCARHLDLALLLIDRRDLAALQLVRGSARAGDPVVALSPRVGSALSQQTRVGRITRADVSLQDQIDPARHRHYDGLLESDTPLVPGFSGGPLLDVDGNLLGVNVAVAGQPDSPNVRGYTIPCDRRTLAEIAALVDTLPPNME